MLAEKPPADYASMEPVSDEVFEVFTRFFERERVPLEPRIESTDESSRHWTKQKVSYAAGYGGERMIAWLYLPRSAKPPYQVMIQMGGAATFYRSPSSATEDAILGWSYAESLIRGGRAVLVPVWKGSSIFRSDESHALEPMLSREALWSAAASDAAFRKRADGNQRARSFPHVRSIQRVLREEVAIVPYDRRWPEQFTAGLRTSSQGHRAR